MKKAKKIAQLKIYFDRSRTYVSYVQLALIIRLSLSDTGIKSDIWVFVGLICCVLAFLFIGYLDTRLGIRRREMENNWNHNPVLREIRKSLKNIEQCKK